MKIKSIKSKLLAALLIFTLLVPCMVTTPVAAAGPYPYSTGDTEVADALNYLRGQQATDGSIGDFGTSAWVVMAIAAAGEDPGSWQVGSNPTIVDYLAANAASATATGDYSRMILAIAAAGEDPTDFGGVDFVSLLEGAFDGTQIGNSAYLNDDFWGVMALVSAGIEPASSTTIQNSVSFILANQNADGGWSWGAGQASDADDSAAAIMALIAAGESPASTPVTDALAYLKGTQLDNGGFDSWGSTNSATDSWGINSIAAAGEDPTSAGWESGLGNDPLDDLLTFQNPDGSFNWTAATPANLEQYTAYAIQALLGAPYPVAVLTPAPGVTVDVRIEGASDTIWSGTVTVNDSTIYDDEGGQHYFAEPTALGALDEAAQAGGFGYTVKDFGWGLAITAIDGTGDWDNGPWWLFLVDGASAQVGADAFILNQTTPPGPPHGEILFALSSTFSEIPLKVEVDDINPGVSEAFTVTVTGYDAGTGSWLPTADATVHAGQDYTTGQDGTAAVTINSDMTVEVYAEKAGYIRSNRVTVTVGEGSVQPADDEEVPMTALIIPAISFTVDPATIDFGELGPRDTSVPVTITLTNEGAWNLDITAEVTDTVEGLYVNGLKLDGLMWDIFTTALPRNGTATCSATLTVPEDYTLTGLQDGTLIFWAADAG